MPDFHPLPRRKSERERLALVAANTRPAPTAAELCGERRVLELQAQAIARELAALPD